MKNTLYNLLMEHIKNETTDYLGYEVNENDIDGIVWNINDDINDRIEEYVKEIQNN